MGDNNVENNNITVRLRGFHEGLPLLQQRNRSDAPESVLLQLTDPVESIWRTVTILIDRRNEFYQSIVPVLQETVPRLFRNIRMETDPPLILEHQMFMENVIGFSYGKLGIHHRAIFYHEIILCLPVEKFMQLAYNTISSCSNDFYLVGRSNLYRLFHNIQQRALQCCAIVQNVLVIIVGVEEYFTELNCFRANQIQNASEMITENGYPMLYRAEALLSRQEYDRACRAVFEGIQVSYCQVSSMYQFAEQVHAFTSDIAFREFENRHAIVRAVRQHLLRGTENQFDGNLLSPP
ncbi:hypothetical protein T4B_9148 [Trichinella pseudospiralis]|uniref:Uncharacterized protein n=1 Tax=Trichinella pseudospiralis TaxID=6337 RepID=A0A0V1HPP6_TRIPS|nr:hypothetical protein T4E_2842 [Trichinella pseudospiralis]KRZ12728.1 hypothetical protein T4B_9148 [Trichinella pseudospiralis]KRZ25881.1 hypothetical protein T4C_12958 [Trichinella pseudospiralis]